jgi:hypothetical protein
MRALQPSVEPHEATDDELAMRDGTGSACPIGYKSGDGSLRGVSVFAKRAGKVVRASDTGPQPRR